jgi:colicin import membrane protein
MSVSVLPRESALMPQKVDGLSAGALMAALVHLLLIMALAFGVSWHASEPEGVTAELWASVPQVAAPQAVEPPPQPVVKETPKPEPKVEPPPKPVQRDADIAIEKEREKQRKLKEQEEQREREREKAQKERLEKEKAEKEKAEAEKRRKEDEARQAALREKLRQEQLQRIQGALGGTGAPSSTGTAARDAGPSASYAGRIKGRIKPNIVFTDEINSLPGNPVAEVELRVAPDGTIVGRRILKSSGVSAWDETVLRAIDKTEVLPRDVDGRVPSSMVIAFRPKD